MPTAALLGCGNNNTAQSLAQQFFRIRKYKSCTQHMQTCIVCSTTAWGAIMNKRHSCTLLEKTKELLIARGDYLDIYVGTGLGPNWLSLLANGKIKDPSVNKVQCLYEYLTNTQLTF